MKCPDHESEIFKEKMDSALEIGTGKVSPKGADQAEYHEKEPNSFDEPQNWVYQRINNGINTR